MTDLRPCINSRYQPFTTRFPRADIYELLTPDLLHQAIKGTYKDHLVTWVEDYLNLEYGRSRGSEILDEVDRRFVFILKFIYQSHPILFPESL